jgi:competence protein ComGC
MKLHNKHFGQRAFTLVEGVVVVAVLALVVAALIPYLTKSKRIAEHITCIGQLERVGIALRLWEEDGHGQWPMAMSVTNGGAMEMLATGNVAACFQEMSNVLSDPVMVLCPGDRRAKVASNFASLSRSNISYFIGLDLPNPNSDFFEAALSGDANLVQNGRVVGSGVLNLGTNPTTWTQDRHRYAGNVLRPEGSVDSLRRGFNFPDGVARFTNRVVVP